VRYLTVQPRRYEDEEGNLLGMRFQRPEDNIFQWCERCGYNRDMPPWLGGCTCAT